MSIVYLVWDVSIISGGMRVIFEHVNGLKKRGHKVEIWSISDNLVPHFECLVDVKKYQPKNLTKPEVVVMTDMVFVNDTAAHRPSKKTYLLLQHDNHWISKVEQHPPDFNDLMAANKSFFKSPNWSIIVASKYVEDTVKKRYSLSSDFIAYGLDHKVFKPVKPLIDSSQPKVLLYYDPQKWKGFSESIGAAMMVKQQIPDLSIMILGINFPELPKTTGISFGFPFPVIYFNRPEQAEMASIYSSADVFISSSWREGFGLPGLEALACGTPLVTTDSGGPREYALDNQTALVVPAKDSKAIADSIFKILSDKKLKNRLVKNGLKKAAEFDWAKTTDQLEKLFKSNSK